MHVTGSCSGLTQIQQNGYFVGALQAHGSSFFGEADPERGRL